jgi:hypothetical protein
MPTLTSNKFKNTEICGNLINSDYPDSSVLASAYFKRDLTVDGNIICSSLNDNLALKSNITYVDGGLLLKADTTYVDSGLALKADTTYVDSGLLLKAGTTYVDGELLLKADTTYVDDGLSLKSDITYVDNGLSFKSDITYVDNGLSLKSDITYVDEQIASVSGSTGLASKADVTCVDNQLALKANLSSPTFTGTVNGITKSMVGLSNVDNTSDASKPVSTAQQTALDLKLDATSGTLVRGIAERFYVRNLAGATITFPANTMACLTTNKSAGGGEFNIVTSNTNYPSGRCCMWETYNGSTYDTLMILSKQGLLTVTGNIVSPTITTINSNIALKADLASPTFTGTVSGITKSMVGLSNVDNTTDLLKPISTATQNALNLKANAASPTFTGTVSGITKSMVGLSNVDNTTDLLKPISTATQNALNLKANAASPSFTGTLTCGGIASSSSTMDISASNYITMMGGLVLVESDGEILARSFIDNTAANKIESTGITCNNLTVTSSMSIPSSVALMAKASCTLTFNGTNYVMSNRQNFRTWPQYSGSVYADKISTGVVSVLIDNATGLNNANFMVSATGSYNDGVTGSSGLIIQIAQKSAFSDGTSTVGYSFKVVITRTNAPSTVVDLATLGRVDLMAFW